MAHEPPSITAEALAPAGVTSRLMETSESWVPVHEAALLSREISTPRLPWTEETVFTVINYLNPLLQQLLRVDYRGKYPRVCGEASTIVLRVFQELFGPSIPIIIREGKRFGSVHYWNELEIGPQMFWLSFTEGQWQIAELWEAYVDAPMTFRKMAYDRMLTQYCQQRLDALTFLRISKDRDQFYYDHGIHHVYPGAAKPREEFIGIQWLMAKLRENVIADYPHWARSLTTQSV